MTDEKYKSLSSEAQDRYLRNVKRIIRVLVSILAVVSFVWWASRVPFSESQSEHSCFAEEEHRIEGFKLEHGTIEYTEDADECTVDTGDWSPGNIWVYHDHDTKQIFYNGKSFKTLGDTLRWIVFEEPKPKEEEDEEVSDYGYDLYAVPCADTADQSG